MTTNDPGRRYANGRAYEYRVRDDLVGDGYWCIRAASSKGCADLVAIKPGQILLVSVKRSNPLPRREERIELVTVARRIGAVPLVAYQSALRKPVQYRKLTGWEPSQWVPWVSDEVAA